MLYKKHCKIKLTQLYEIMDIALLRVFLIKKKMAPQRKKKII